MGSSNGEGDIFQNAFIKRRGLVIYGYPGIFSRLSGKFLTASFNENFLSFVIVAYRLSDHCVSRVAQVAHLSLILIEEMNNNALALGNDGYCIINGEV